MDYPATQENLVSATDRGIPLTVVRTYSANGKSLVDFEDEDGVVFTVPREAVAADAERQHKLFHSDIRLPEDKLADIWNSAAEKQMPEEAPQDPDLPELPPYSAYERWRETHDTLPVHKTTEQTSPVVTPTRPSPMVTTTQPSTAVNQVMQEGGFVRNVVPTAEKSYSQPVANPVSLFNSTKPRAPSIRRKEDIPADAGSGWGNWNQVWNPRRQRWETPRSR